MSESRQRRMYLVDRAFQLKYILLLMGWGVVLAALFGLWTYQAHQQAVETVLRDPAQRALMARGERQLVWALLGIGALSAAALGLLAFIMTHRVAGPIYVMGHYLTLLAEGRYPPRRALRRHDELKQFYGHFVDVMEVLKERDARCLTTLEDAATAIRGVALREPALVSALEQLEREAASRREALAEAAHPVDAAPAAARN